MSFKTMCMNQDIRGRKPHKPVRGTYDGNAIVTCATCGRRMDDVSPESVLENASNEDEVEEV